MDRYTLLFVLNLPFIIFGILRAFAMYKTGLVSLAGLVTRLLFWGLIAFALGFSQKVYLWLYDEKLVNGKDISLPVVILTTGIIFSFFLIIRLYTKIDAVEKRQSELITALSIASSERLNSKR